MAEETMKQRLDRITSEANAKNKIRADREKVGMGSMASDLSNLSVSKKKPIVKPIIKKEEPLTLRQKIKARDDALMAIGK